MVRKLLKHEAIYYARTLLPVEAILVGWGALTRFVQLFESDSVVYDILFGSSVFVLILGCFACLLFAVAMGVVRFYKNMYTAEGYLTFTLPATEAQHIRAKLIAAVLASVSAFLALVISLLVASSWDLLTELWNVAVYLCRLATPLVGGHLYAYLILLAVLMVLGSAGGYLFYYTCLSVGQLSKKNRILASVGVYFGYQVAMQILSSIFSVLLPLIFASVDVEAVVAFVETHLVGVLYGAFGVLLVWELLYITVLFVLVRFITRKKLNLE